MAFPKIGKPKSDHVDTLQAKAWFSVISRLGAGAESVFLDIEKPLSTTEIDKRLGVAAFESRLSRKWRNGENKPSITHRVNLYVYFKWIDKKALNDNHGWHGHNIINHSALASAELTLNTGPDGSNLWDVLRDARKIDDTLDMATDCVCPSMANATNYLDVLKMKFSMDLCIPIFTALLAEAMRKQSEKKLSEAMLHMVDYFYSPEVIFNEENINSEIELTNSFYVLCSKRLEWYGITTKEVLSIANIKLKII